MQRGSILAPIFTSWRLPRIALRKISESSAPFTSDLHRLADWLAEHHIETVVMESTGVYRISLFQILEQRGFEVKLVNAAHVKNLPGRKSDVSDCKWLQQLHTFGVFGCQTASKFLVSRTGGGLRIFQKEILHSASTIGSMFSLSV